MDHTTQNPSSSKAADRKTIEKNRRNQMKTLYTKLNSLVPQQTKFGPQEAVSLPDQLERATNYIKNLEVDLEKLKQKKNSLVEGPAAGRSSGGSNGSTQIGDIKLPNIDIHVMGTALEVVLITGLNCQSMFSETITILHDEDAEVANASFSVIGDAIFHTILCKIGECAPEQEAARISERLRKFVHDWC